MRTVSWLRWGCLALLLASCAKSAGANQSLTTTTTVASAAPVETRLVTITTGPSTVPQETVPVELVDDCVVYVAYAAGQGDPYMSMLWNASGGDEAKVRVACEEQWYKTDDANADGVPDGQAELERMSQEKKELDAFFNQFTTTTSAGTATGTTLAGTPVCEPGMVLTTDFHCVEA